MERHRASAASPLLRGNYEKEMILLTDMDILEYGWKGMVVALITCFIIGLIKTPVKAAIKKRTNDDVGRLFGAIAFCVSAVMGAAGAIVFSRIFGCFECASTAGIGFTLWVVSMTQFLYAMYEKLGFRETLKKLLTVILPFIGKSGADAEKLLSGLGGETADKTASGGNANPSGDDGQKPDNAAGTDK